MFPSLAAEVSRQAEPVRRVFSEGLKDYLDALDTLSDGDGIAVLSTLVGAMVLARASEDKALSDKILTQATQALKQRKHTDRSVINQD